MGTGEGEPAQLGSSGQRRDGTSTTHFPCQSPHPAFLLELTPNHPFLRPRAEDGGRPLVSLASLPPPFVTIP